MVMTFDYYYGAQAEQFFDVVIFDGLHTLDALATAVLSFEIVNMNNILEIYA